MSTKTSRGHSGTVGRRLAVTAAAAALIAPVATSAASTSASSISSSTAASAVTSGTYCGITWGSLAKKTSPGALWSGSVTAARYGKHTCFDRLVLDVAKGAGTLGYNVRYVSTVTGPGSGLPVAVSGGAKIQVTVNAPATMRIPSSGSVTFTGWQTFRQLKWVGSFEGYTDFGLGVRARLPMRTFVLANPDGSKRLVVDVAHFW